MDKLLPCPICGKELTVHGPEDWTPSFYDPDSGGGPYSANCDCGFLFMTNHYDYAEFVEDLNLRAQPENKPLTLNELREMDGEPVWLETGEISIGEQIIGCWEILEKVTKTPVEAFWFSRRKVGFTEITYGKTWLAYRYKPEEVRG